MGQSQSVTDSVDALRMQIVRHIKVLSEITCLTYEEFTQCVQSLNQLSRKCISPNGKQLVFLVEKGSDSSVFWKATVKIACVKVEPSTSNIESYKFLNLKQFMCVFKTFQAHLDSLVSSEQLLSSRRSSEESSPDTQGPNWNASMLMDIVNNVVICDKDSTLSETPNDECSICLDRKTEVILPCAHSFCTPCIEQWNFNNKTCPICCEKLDSTDDTWILPDIPGVEEINDKICSEFISLMKSSTD